MIVQIFVLLSLTNTKAEIAPFEILCELQGHSTNFDSSILKHYSSGEEWSEGIELMEDD